MIPPRRCASMEHTARSRKYWSPAHFLLVFVSQLYYSWFKICIRRPQSQRLGRQNGPKALKMIGRRLTDISFIVKDKAWGSSIMRGQMVSDALKGRNYNVQYVRTESFLRHASTIGGICVCVKFCPEAVVITCRTLRRAVIWDVLDMDVEQYSNQTLSGLISVFLANSRYHASMLLSAFNVSAVKVAYHHHSNTFSLSRHWNASTVPKRLCLTASPLNMPTNAASVGVRAWNISGDARATSGGAQVLSSESAI
jgi:hypothetical protein